MKYKIVRLALGILVPVLLNSCIGGSQDIKNNNNNNGGNSDKKQLSKLQIEITLANPYSNLISNNIIDMREFGIDMIMDIKYINNQKYEIKLQPSGFDFANSCKNPDNPKDSRFLRACPTVEILYDSIKNQNECNSYPGNFTKLKPGEACIQRVQVVNGINITHSEIIDLPEHAGGYYYEPVDNSPIGNPNHQSFESKLNLKARIGVTQYLKTVSENYFNPNSALIVSPDGSFVYRVEGKGGRLCKFQVTYNDTEKSAFLNPNPISYYKPSDDPFNTIPIGVANDGAPIGDSQYVGGFPRNYETGMNYTYGTPQVLYNFNKIFLGLDNKNYLYSATRDNIAIMDTNNPQVNILPIALDSRRDYAVDKLGNIIEGEGGGHGYTGVKCYMKNQNYQPIALNIGVYPSWVKTEVAHPIGTLTQMGSLVYAWVKDNQGFTKAVSINPNNCSVNWDDVRTFYGNGALGLGHDVLFTTNQRVLYVVWDHGSLWYYPYPPKN